MTQIPAIPASFEAALREEVRRRAPDVVALATELIAFDTTARHWDAEPGEEAALQAHLADRLARSGFEVELWEPGAEELAGHPQLPAGFHSRGRPQLVARRAGTGGGRSLLLNGHVDVVPVEPLAAWTSDPFAAEVRDGRLYGRGACDMKGGVAAMVVAAEAIAALGLPLAGDLVVCTVTDEESTGAGAIGAVAHGVRADAGLVPEPTELEAWTATRGSLVPKVTVAGRAGHAGVAQPSPPEGAANAILKASVILAELGRLHEEWRTRPDLRHPLLVAPHVLPTGFVSEDWIVSHPDACELRFHVTYHPSQADADGGGTAVVRELASRVQAAAQADPWLREHPPVLTCSVSGPPMEVPVDEPVVRVALDAARLVGRAGRVATRTTWFDAVTFTRAGTPTIGFGPGDILDAHTIDESVAVEELGSSAEALAVAALRFCSAE